MAKAAATRCTAAPVASGTCCQCWGYGSHEIGGAVLGGGGRCVNSARAAESVDLYRLAQVRHQRQRLRTVGPVARCQSVSQLCVRRIVRAGQAVARQAR